MECLTLSLRSAFEIQLWSQYVSVRRPFVARQGALAGASQSCFHCEIPEPEIDELALLLVAAKELLSCCCRITVIQNPRSPKQEETCCHPKSRLTTLEPCCFGVSTSPESSRWSIAAASRVCHHAAAVKPVVFQRESFAISEYRRLEPIIREEEVVCATSSQEEGKFRSPIRRDLPLCKCHLAVLRKDVTV